jgi:hypothetical protein
MCSEEMYSYLGSAHRRRPALGRVVRQSAISRGRKVAPVRRAPRTWSRLSRTQWSHNNSAKAGQMALRFFVAYTPDRPHDTNLGRLSMANYQFGLKCGSFDLLIPLPVIRDCLVVLVNSASPSKISRLELLVTLLQHAQGASKHAP